MTTLKELRDRAKGLGIKGASKMNTAEVTAAIAEKEGPQPIEVTGSNGRSVKVERRGAKILVTWMCGGTREFTDDDLRMAIERFEVVASHGIWYEDDDSGYSPYAAVLQDGQFHGDDHVNGNSDTVPWDEFKAALQANLS
jgi:hypothetical protein